jgi:hypothetical protein
VLRQDALGIADQQETTVPAIQSGTLDALLNSSLRVCLV